jgi:hypothetical protein
MAEMMKWSDLEMIVYGKKLLRGEASEVILGLGVIKSWKKLKKQLLKLYDPKTSPAQIHEEMRMRRMLPGESFRLYAVRMEEIGRRGDLIAKDVIFYTVKGIMANESTRMSLLECETLSELRVKLDKLQKVKDEMSFDRSKKFEKKIDEKGVGKIEEKGKSHNVSVKKSELKTGETSVLRCFKCGGKGHYANDCTGEIKCFKCRGVGHKSNECKVERSMVAITGKKRMSDREIMVNGEVVKGVIDTGSDFTMCRKKLADKLGLKYDVKGKIGVKGVGGCSPESVGSCAVEVVLGGNPYSVNLNVMKDKDLPVEFLIGLDLLERVTLLMRGGKIDVVER